MVVRVMRGRGKAAWGVELSGAVLERQAGDLLKAGLVEQGSLTDLPYEGGCPASPRACRARCFGAVDASGRPTAPSAYVRCLCCARCAGSQFGLVVCAPPPLTSPRPCAFRAITRLATPSAFGSCLPFRTRRRLPV